MNKKAFLLYFSLLIAPPSLWAQSFEPGQWKFKDSVELNGLTLPASNNEECISETQAKDAKAAIVKELGKQGCALTKWEVKNQKLEAALDCKKGDIDAVGSLSGEFSRKSYDLKGRADGTYKKAIPAVADFHLTGQWMKKCPKK